MAVILFAFSGTGLRQHQPGGGGVGRERVQAFEPLAAVVGPTCGRAVDGNEVVPPGPQRLHPVLEAAREQDRDPVDQQRSQRSYGIA